MAGCLRVVVSAEPPRASFFSHGRKHVSSRGAAHRRDRNGLHDCHTGSVCGFTTTYAGPQGLGTPGVAVEKSLWQRTAPGEESSPLGPVPLDGRTSAGTAHRTTSGASPYLDGMWKP